MSESREHEQGLRRALDPPPEPEYSLARVLPEWESLVAAKKAGPCSRDVSPRFERESASTGVDEVLMDMNSLFPLNNESQSVRNVPLIPSARPPRTVIPNFRRAQPLAATEGEPQIESHCGSMALWRQRSSNSDAPLPDNPNTIEERLHSGRSSDNDTPRGRTQNGRRKWWFMSPSPVSALSSPKLSRHASLEDDDAPNKAKSIPPPTEVLEFAEIDGNVPPSSLFGRTIFVARRTSQLSRLAGGRSRSEPEAQRQDSNAGEHKPSGVKFWPSLSSLSARRSSLVKQLTGIAAGPHRSGSTSMLRSPSPELTPEPTAASHRVQHLRVEALAAPGRVASSASNPECWSSSGTASHPGARALWAKATWLALQAARTRREELQQSGSKRMSVIAFNGKRLSGAAHSSLKRRSAARLSEGGASTPLNRDPSRHSILLSPEVLMERDASAPGPFRTPSFADGGMSPDAMSRGSLSRQVQSPFARVSSPYPTRPDGGCCGIRSPWAARMRARARRIRANAKVQLLLLLASVYVLVVPDLYYLLQSSPRGDYGLFTTTFVVAVLMLMEVVLKTATSRAYAGSSWMLLDVAVLLSLLPDVTWWAAEVDVFALAGSMVFARAARAARAGARATRVLRVLSVVRRWRCLGCIFGGRGRGDGWSDSDSEDLYGEEEEEEEESELVKGLEDNVSKLVIAVAVAMLVVTVMVGSLLLPRWVTTEGAEGELEMLATVRALLEEEVGGGGGGRRGGGEGQGFQTVVDDFVRGKAAHGTPVLYLCVDGEVVYGDAAAVEGVRPFPPEWEGFATETAQGVSEMHLGTRGAAKQQAVYNLVMLASVVVVVGGCAMVFMEHLRRRVALPLLSLVALVKAFTDDPLAPLVPREQPREAEEVRHLRGSLCKLANLLQVALGEAGSKIISNGLRGSWRAGADGGKIVHAFFGFCDIRNFTDLTEVLQDDVVRVVNQVARHVHGAVTEGFGAPNKNMGDAFLLVWKPTQLELGASEVADSALRSYIRIIIDLARCRELARWTQRADLQERLPGFRMQLGFGLHYGWAVEAAIGSAYKLDASYLSPHVNLAARLESATKIYNVMILISGDTFRLLSAHVQGLCRLMDRVTVKGSIQPMELYTYDVPELQSQGGTVPDDIDWWQLSERESLDRPAAEESSPTAARWDRDVSHGSRYRSSLDEFFRAVPPTTSKGWRSQFSKAVEAYLGGPHGRDADWVVARRLLQDVLRERPHDGPGLALLEFIEEAAGPSGAAPRDWPGYKALQDK